MEYMAERLKSLREEKNKTQAQVAESIGISVAAYSYYENGKRMPRVPVMFKLADYFGVKPSDIFFKE